MVTFAHEQLIDRLAKVEEPPHDEASFREWIRGRNHLELLQRNAEEDEIIVAALSPAQTCINSFIARADHPDLQGDVAAMAQWSPNPLHHDAMSYSWSWGSDGVHPMPRGGSLWHELPPDVYPLVFGRTIDGVPEQEGMYYEIAQEYTHVSGIHWRPERRAYARFDHRGDWMDVISVSDRSGSYYADVVSFQRESLELHLIAMNAVLVRTFDLTLRRPAQAFKHDYTDHVDRIVRVGSGLCYREMVNEGQFGFIRGVQIIAPTLTPSEVEQLVDTGYIPDEKEAVPVEFIVDDLRNHRITTVSTDPATTTNYFVAHENELPYDTSPASFRPEVLSKYTADKEKYTIQEELIDCRASWSLRRYWVNEAGQVCAYICDLRDLPHEEQVHWSLYNEDPKAELPEHVVKTDFRGEWLEEEDVTPMVALRELLRRWQRDGVDWWRWNAERSPDRLAVPRTGSRDEWLDGCLSLSNGVVEGFRPGAIRARLTAVGGEYEAKERSILLLERILRIRGLIEEDERVPALWDVNELRVHGKAHATGGKGRQLSDAALRAHGSYAAHFEDLCTRLLAELKLIEDAFR